MVKSPALDDLSEPKSSTTTVSVVPLPDPVVVLYIKAPLAVRVLEENVRSAKSVNAVVPEDNLIACQFALGKFQLAQP